MIAEEFRRYMGVLGEAKISEDPNLCGHLLDEVSLNDFGLTPSQIAALYAALDIQGEFHLQNLCKLSAEDIKAIPSYGLMRGFFLWLQVVYLVKTHSMNCENSKHLYISEIFDLEQIRSRPLSTLKLSTRSLNALERIKVTSTYELSKVSIEDISAISNLGKNSVNEILREQAKLNLWRDRIGNSHLNRLDGISEPIDLLEMSTRTG